MYYLEMFLVTILVIKHNFANVYSHLWYDIEFWLDSFLNLRTFRFQNVILRTMLKEQHGLHAVPTSLTKSSHHTMSVHLWNIPIRETIFTCSELKTKQTNMWHQRSNFISHLLINRHFIPKFQYLNNYSSLLTPFCLFI